MRMKLVAVLCGALILSSCASTPEYAATSESTVRPESVNAREPVRQTARDAFVSAIFEPRQKSWVMLCDNRELSAGIRNDATTLFVRAIVWNDGDSTLGLEPSSRQPIGDLSTLLIHFGGGTVRTAGRDVNVSLNPWPQVSGIRVQQYRSEMATTTMQEVQGASGSIKYVPDAGGKLIRTDEYEVPLSALGLERGAAISVAFYALSAVPAFATSCSTGFERGNFYPPSIPVARYLSVTLQSE